MRRATPSRDCRSSLPIGALVLVLLVCGTAVPAGGQAGTATSADPSARTQAVLDSVLRTPPLSRAHWGVAVHALADGAPVLRHNADRLFTAASTMKLVTVVAALDRLGPRYRFETAVEVDLDARGHADSLVVRGSGDPSLGEPFHSDPLAPLDSLADSLRALGLRAVDGPLIIDQSRFDSTLVHPAWESFDLDWYYAAPVSPFAVMGGAFEVVVTPGTAGTPAGVTISHGAGLIGLDARIMTVPGPDDWDDVLRRIQNADSLILRGTIGAGSGPDTSRIAQVRPGHTAGMALRRTLEQDGIRVTGPVVVRYRSGQEETGRSGHETVIWRSPPLEAIIRVALERSDNWVTEQVLKAMTAVLLDRGDWSSGTDLVEEYLAWTVGVPRDAIYMRDGSGLTPQGLLTPDAVVTLLRYADTQPWGPQLRDALASPGEPESTLDDRLLGHEGRVVAKTGTLRHVNALSGYLTTRDGRALVFSILSNGSGRPSWEVQAAIDRIVNTIIESGS